MSDILNDLYASMKEEKGVFNIMSNEDLRNLSAFFQIQNIADGEIYGKKRALAII